MIYKFLPSTKWPFSWKMSMKHLIAREYVSKFVKNLTVWLSLLYQTKNTSRLWISFKPKINYTDFSRSLEAGEYLDLLKSLCFICFALWNTFWTESKKLTQRELRASLANIIYSNVIFLFEGANVRGLSTFCWFVGMLFRG